MLGKPDGEQDSPIPSQPGGLTLFWCSPWYHKPSHHTASGVQTCLHTNFLDFFFAKKCCSYHCCHWWISSTAVLHSIYCCDPYISCKRLFLLRVPLLNTHMPCTLASASLVHTSPPLPQSTLGMCASLAQMVWFLRAAKKSPCKIAEPSACSRTKHMTCNLIAVFLNILAPPFLSVLAVLHTSSRRSCSSGVVLNLCLGYKSLCTVQITRNHQIISHETNDASQDCTDYSS